MTFVADHVPIGIDRGHVRFTAGTDYKMYLGVGLALLVKQAIECCGRATHAEADLQRVEEIAIWAFELCLERSGHGCMSGIAISH